MGSGFVLFESFLLSFYLGPLGIVCVKLFSGALYTWVGVSWTRKTRTRIPGQRSASPLFEASRCLTGSRETILPLISGQRGQDTETKTAPSSLQLFFFSHTGGDESVTAPTRPRWVVVSGGGFVSGCVSSRPLTRVLVWTTQCNYTLTSNDKITVASCRRFSSKSMRLRGL